MKKPSAAKKATTPAKPKPDGLTTLVTELRQLIQSARRGVATVVDTFQVMTSHRVDAPRTAKRRSAKVAVLESGEELFAFGFGISLHEATTFAPALPSG